MIKTENRMRCEGCYSIEKLEPVQNIQLSTG